MARPRGSLALLALTLALLMAPAGAIPTDLSIAFASGSFNRHPCNGNQCDDNAAYAAITKVDSYYGKSRSVSFTVSASWNGGTEDGNYCYCRNRANMYGFDDPLKDALSAFNPQTSATDGISAAGGALSDSKLEPWGTHWYRCWDQNSDTPPLIAAGTNSLTITGPSDAPFVNLPDGYYHFTVSCTEDIGVTFLTTDMFYKIDNVAPETTITPYIAALDSSLTGATGELPSYDPAAFDHRLRYRKTSNTNPTNQVPARLFDFKFSAVDYHGSVGPDTSYDPYSGSPVTSKNMHATMATAETFWAELERIVYQCKIDGGNWEACQNNNIMTRYSDTNYGHNYFSKVSTTSFDGMRTGVRYWTSKQLAAGTHVLMVRATDIAGNTEMPTMYSFYVAPYTTGGYSSGCSFGTKITNNMGAEYSQTAFDLTTDTKVAYSGLTDGTHTLTIFAKDDFGHETAEAARQTVSWTVDRTAPSATLLKSWVMRNTATDSSYVTNNGAASRTDAVYEWSFSNSSTMAVPTYSKYSIDGGAYVMDGFVASTSSSSAGFSSLAMPPFSHTFGKGTFSVGAHSVSVMGVDYVGNEGAAAAETFTVEELDTLLNCDNCAICDWSADMGCHSCQELSSAYVSDSVTFDIGAKTDGRSIRFKYDYIFGSSAMADSYTKGEHIPEFTVRNIGEGKYYVMAKGRTLGGTVDATPACVMLSTDLTKPVTTFNSELKRINNLERMPTKVAGTVVDANWKYDGINWKVMQMGVMAPLATATSAQAVTGASAKMLVTADPTNENVAVWELDLSDLVSSGMLGEGKYFLIIHATDKAGHTGMDVSYDWMIDMGPPDTHVVNGPSSASIEPAVTLTFACEESGDYSYCSYKYRAVPGGEWTEAECNLDRFCRVSLTAAPGVNTLEVKAVDLAGNEDASSQYYTWMMYDSEAWNNLKSMANFTTPWAASKPTFPMPDQNEVQLPSV
eukprot:jgi/Tetstr1/426338/TSEL_016651.t1